jgi:hypothetical protein
MNTFLLGSLSAVALMAFTSPIHAQVVDSSIELAFMPRTMTVTLLNEGGKYVAVDLKHIPLCRSPDKLWGLPVYDNVRPF